MFIIPIFLIILFSFSIEAIFKKKSFIFPAFIFLFISYTFLTMTASSLHVDGSFNITIFILLLVLPIPYGLYKIHKNNQWIIYAKKFSLLILITAILSIFFILRPTPINTSLDYRLYLPMMNSVSGNVNMGVPVSEVLYSKLSIYHFLGVIKFISMNNVPTFLHITVPILVSLIFSMVILELKKFKVLAIIALIFVFQVNILNNYLSYGSFFFAPLFAGLAIYYLLKNKVVVSAVLLLSSIYCATYISVWVVLLSFVFMVYIILKTKKINFATFIIYGSIMLNAIVVSMVVKFRATNNFYIDAVFLLTFITIVGILILKINLSISLPKLMKLNININIKKALLSMIIVFGFIAYGFIYLYTNHRFTDTLIFYSFKYYKTNLFLFIASSIIINLVLIWMSKDIKKSGLLVILNAAIIISILVLSFYPIMPNYIAVRMFKSLTTTSSFAMPFIFITLVSSNDLLKKNSKASFAFEVFWILLIASLLTASYVNIPPKIQGINTWMGISKTNIKYLSGGVYNPTK